MKIRFQADNDLNQLIIKAILRREPTIDFQTPQALGLSGLKDEAVLAIVAKEDRLLVTHDWKTMPFHFAEFIKDNTSPRVIIVPQTLPVIRAVEAIILIWAVTDVDEWKNRIHLLPL